MASMPTAHATNTLAEQTKPAAFGMSPAHVTGRPVRSYWLVMKWPSAIGSDSIHTTILSPLKIDPNRVNMIRGRL